MASWPARGRLHTECSSFVTAHAHTTTRLHALGPPPYGWRHSQGVTLLVWQSLGPRRGMSSQRSRRSRSSYTSSPFFTVKHSLFSLPSSLLNTGSSSYSFFLALTSTPPQSTSARRTAARYRCALGTASLRVETQPRRYPCWCGIAWFLVATASPAAHRSLFLLSQSTPSCLLRSTSRLVGRAAVVLGCQLELRFKLCDLSIFRSHLDKEISCTIVTK